MEDEDDPFTSFDMAAWNKKIEARGIEKSAHFRTMAEDALFQALPETNKLKALRSHLAKRRPHISGWTKIGTHNLSKLPRHLAVYMGELCDRLDGPELDAFPRILHAILVRSQALAMTYLIDHIELGYGSVLPTFVHFRPGSKFKTFGACDHLRMICTYHREQTPSMAYSKTSRQWHCYGCGTTATHWSKTAYILGLNDREAIDFLRRVVGMPAPPWPLPATRRNPVLQVYGHVLDSMAADR